MEQPVSSCDLLTLPIIYQSGWQRVAATKCRRKEQSKPRTSREPWQKRYEIIPKKQQTKNTKEKMPSKMDEFDDVDDCYDML